MMICQGWSRRIRKIRGKYNQGYCAEIKFWEYTLQYKLNNFNVKESYRVYNTYVGVSRWVPEVNTAVKRWILRERRDSLKAAISKA